MSRDYQKEGRTAVNEEVDVQQDHDQERMRMMASHRRHQQRKKEPSETEKAQAGQFKEAMKRKVEGVSGTVTMAVALFESAMLAEKLADKPHGPTDKLIDIVINVLFSQLTSTLKDALGLSGALGVVFKQAMSIAKSAAKGGHEPQGEMQTINEIASTATTAADRFIDCFKNLVDAMPIEQAAQDMKLMQATLGSPAVEDAADTDSPEAGNVKEGVENQFLEAAGAPVTGPAQAEAIATEMLRTYKAERIHTYDTPEATSNAVKETLADKAPGEINKAEKNIGVDGDVQKDKAERARASDVGND